MRRRAGRGCAPPRRHAERPPGRSRPTWPDPGRRGVAEDRHGWLYPCRGRHGAGAPPARRPAPRRARSRATGQHGRDHAGQVGVVGDKEARGTGKHAAVHGGVVIGGRAGLDPEGGPVFIRQPVGQRQRVRNGAAQRVTRGRRCRPCGDDEYLLLPARDTAGGQRAGVDGLHRGHGGQRDVRPAGDGTGQGRGNDGGDGGRRIPAVATCRLHASPATPGRPVTRSPTVPPGVAPHPPLRWRCRR